MFRIFLGHISIVNIMTDAILPRSTPHIAVIIPCYRVKNHVLAVIQRIGAEVQTIYVIDDACPEQSGQWVLQHNTDARVVVLHHAINKGVGGAVITGYTAALANGADIMVKIDGDGQMDPALLPKIIRPIVLGEADYSKGNRFYSLWSVRQMPRMRLFGNAALSFLTKASSGYWHIFDPSNGYTAVHRVALQHINLKHVQQRYFFETDMLIHLSNVHAVVRDVPMEAQYGHEVSGLKISKILWPFWRDNCRALLRRIVYNYFMRDFNIASLQLLVGMAFLTFGFIFGAVHWYGAAQEGIATPTGTIMLAILPIILGVNLLLAFISFDIQNFSKTPLQKIYTSLP